MEGHCQTALCSDRAQIILVGQYTWCYEGRVCRGINVRYDLLNHKVEMCELELCRAGDFHVCVVMKQHLSFLLERQTAKLC